MGDVALPIHANGVSLSINELLPYQNQIVRWLAPANNIWSQLNGQHQSTQKGRGMNFTEVRQYQAGDDIRSIDWRVTARTGKTHTKLFAEEREQPTILYLDLRPSMFFGSSFMLKSVQLAHMASLISWLTVEQHDRIGAVIDTGSRFIEIRPTARKKGALTILQHLIEQHNHIITNIHQFDSINFIDSNQNMTSSLQILNRIAPKGSEIILLSDFLHCKEGDRPLISQLRKHNQVRWVHIFDPLEQGKTSYRGTEKVSDGRQTQWLNFASKKVRQQIEQSFETHQQKLIDLCRSHAIAYTSISSGSGLLQQIQTMN